MMQVGQSEIQRLRRLHQSAELEILLLAARRFPTAAEQTELRDLKKRKLALKDRIAWLESLFQQQNEVCDLAQP
ncbi:MAG TPA: YdcH family protein [Polyangiaceae bacterium]|nr:YdcH family protein [Polyangiaceae bacterium]